MIIKRLSVGCVLIIALLFSSISNSKDNFKIMDLKGKINNSYDIHMEVKPIVVDKSKLHGDDSFLHYEGVICKYSGYYYYDKYAKKILIDGYLYSGGYIQLTEYDEKNKASGNFCGFIKDDKIIKGVWRSTKGKDYPFYLFDSKMKPEDFDLNVLFDRVGSYDRIGNDKVDQGYLYIEAEGNGKFIFEISAYWVTNPGAEAPYANLGMVDGIAFYTDESRTKAEYFNKDDNLKIHFKFSGKQVVITANDVISHYCGMNVSLVGTYKKTK